MKNSFFKKVGGWFGTLILIIFFYLAVTFLAQTILGTCIHNFLFTPVNKILGVCQ